MNERGKPYQYIAIRADITARKAAEERLAQQAALARLGQMAAVVAHEVRNPLAGIKGAMQVLMGRRADGDPDRLIMREVVARIDSLGDLVNDLMVFARPSPPHPSTFPLRPLLQEAIDAVRRDPIASTIDVTLDGADVLVTADAPMIRAAMLNLLLNAAQAMDGHGSITVSLTHRDRPVHDRRARHRPRRADRDPRSRIRAVLHDQGPRRRPRAADCAAHGGTARRRVVACVHPSRRRNFHADPALPPR